MPFSIVSCTNSRAKTTISKRIHTSNGYVKLIVVGAQPLDEFDYRGVTPHPRRKAPQTGERFYCFGVALLAAHIAIHAICAGQSASSAIAVNPFSLMSRLVI